MHIQSPWRSASPGVPLEIGNVIRAFVSSTNSPTNSSGTAMADHVLAGGSHRAVGPAPMSASHTPRLAK